MGLHLPDWTAFADTSFPKTGVAHLHTSIHTIFQTPPLSSLFPSHLLRGYMLICRSRSARSDCDDDPCYGEGAHSPGASAPISRPGRPAAHPHMYVYVHRQHQNTTQRHALHDAIMLTRTSFTAETIESTEFGITDTAQLSRVVREHGSTTTTSVTRRATRFTSNHHAQHHPVTTVAIPAEERHIYASIEVLKERIEQLQREKSAIQQGSEDKDHEILALRNQLAATTPRPDSGFGAPEVDAQEFREKSQQYDGLQKTFNALQDAYMAKSRAHEEQVNDLNNECTNYKQKLAKALSECTEYKQGLAHALSEIEELNRDEEDFNRLGEQLSKVTQERNGSRHLVLGLKKKVEQLNATNNDLLQRNILLPARIDECAGVAGDIETENIKTKLSERIAEYEYTAPSTAQHLRAPGGVSAHSTTTPQHITSSTAGEGPEDSMLPERSPAALPYSMRALVNGIWAPASQYAYNDTDGVSRFQSQKMRTNKNKLPRDISSANWSDLDLRHNSAPRPSEVLKQHSTNTTSHEEHAFDATEYERQTSFTEDAEGWTSFGDHSISSGMAEVIANTRRNSKHCLLQDNDTKNLTGLSQAEVDASNSELVRSQLEKERQASRQLSGMSAQFLLQALQSRKGSNKKVTIKSPQNSDEAEPQLASASNNSMKENQAATDKSAAADFVSFSGQKSLRDYQNIAEQESSAPGQKSSAGSSTHSGKRYERKSPAKDGETSAFILPDINLSSTYLSLPTTKKATTGRVVSWVDKVQAGGAQGYREPSAMINESVPDLPEEEAFMPVRVTERLDYKENNKTNDNEEDIASNAEADIDASAISIRPSQPPPQALAMLIQQMEHEVNHLKEQLAVHNIAFIQHDPAIGQRKRMALKKTVAQYTEEVEKRSAQCYALYDVLEGTKGVF